MSVIDLQAVKLAIRIDTDDADSVLQMYLNTAEADLCAFLNRAYLPTIPQDFPPLKDADGNPVGETVATSLNVAPQVFSAVCLLVQAQANTEDAAEIARIREVAFDFVRPFRVRMGA